ncbi:hypothetical protein ACM64Y_18805 [Novispirillum sp. DQ9]|uniref:hypothetical protein n=1 Tax=Novispirillum sp. DQ9 TaxID=3398612 RepID=UPI003C7C6B69
MPTLRPYRPIKPAPALRPKRAAVFVLLALGGLALGARLAHTPPAPEGARAMAPVLAWQDGGVVVVPPHPGEGLD